MDSQDLEQKKKEARLAMAGEDFERREKIKAEDLQKRRLDAQLAMESSTHKMMRQEKERLARQREEGRRLIAEEKARHAEEVARRQAKLAEQEKQEKNRREFERLRREEKFQAKQDLIEDLKSAPDIRVSPIRTLGEDISRLPNQKFNTGQEKKIIYRSTTEEEKYPHKNRRLVIVVTLIALVIVSASFFAIFFNQQKFSNSAPQIPVATPLIFSENNIAFNVADLPALIIYNTIKVLTNQGGNKNTITNLQPYFSATTSDGQVTVSNIGLTDFLKRSQMPLSPDLVRYLNDRFMIGFYQGQTEAKTFFIFSVDETDYAKSWILKNETDLLATTLEPFHNNPNFLHELNSKNIVDVSIKNKDARVAKNKAGQTIALYAWLDPQTLLVAQDEDSFIKIIDAFNTPTPNR